VELDNNQITPSSPIRTSPPIQPRPERLDSASIQNRVNQSVNIALPDDKPELAVEDQPVIPEAHLVLEPIDNPKDFIEVVPENDISQQMVNGVPHVEIEPASGIKPTATINPRPGVSMVDVRPPSKNSDTPPTPKPSIVTEIHPIAGGESKVVFNPTQPKKSSKKIFAFGLGTAVALAVVGFVMIEYVL